MGVSLRKAKALNCKKYHPEEVVLFQKRETDAGFQCTNKGLWL
jgi:hypothetical protein